MKTLRNGLILIWTLGASYFVAVRVLYWPPDGGDASVWFAIWEWMSRGELVYESVWDHKDVGFLLINSLVYNIGEVQGNYIFAFALVFAWGSGIYILLRNRFSRSRSWVLAIAATVLYVAPDSFLSVYTEHQAISIAVLAFALYRKAPASSGVLFTVAISIKLAVFPLALVVFTVLAIQFLANRSRHDGNLLKRFGIGLAASFTALVLALTLSGIMPQWVEVIAFNREYASFRNQQSVIESVYQFWIQIVQAPLGFLLLVNVILFLVFLGYTIKNGFPKTLLDSRQGDATAILFGLVSVVILLPQYPMSFHHMQFAWGGLLLSFFSNFWLLSRALSRGTKHVFGSLALVCLLFAFLTPSIWDNSLVENPKKMLEKYNALNLSRISSGDINIQDARSVVIIGGSEPALDTRVLSSQTDLSCRFTYFFVHMFDSYGTEFSDCILSKRPDLILADDRQLESFVSSTSSGPELSHTLRRNYTLCDEKIGIYSVFRLRAENCLSKATE